MFGPKPIECTLINSALAGAGTAHRIVAFTYKTVIVTMTGAGATTVLIQVSNDNTNWVTVDIITGDDYYETTAAYLYIRANITVAGGKTVLATLVANK